MGVIAGVSAIIGTILAILTFYIGTYLPYINGENNWATEAFTPVLRAIPGAEVQHKENSPGPVQTGPVQTGPVQTGPADENGDRTPPDIFVPDDFTEEATGPDGAEVSFEVSAEDNVDGSAALNADGTTTQDDVGGDITISCAAASDSTFPIDTTEVTCNAEDSTGNDAEQKSFTVTVQDTTPPDICDEDFTEEATGPDGAEVSFEVCAEDNVDGPVPVNCNLPSDSIFPIGTTEITCNATDAAGNTGEESFTVTVEGTIVPGFVPEPEQPEPEQPEPEQPEPDGNVTESG